MRVASRCVVLLLLVWAFGARPGVAQSLPAGRAGSVGSEACRAAGSRVDKPILTGAERMDAYVPRLLHKRVALVCNHTSRVRGRRLVDTLLSRGVDVVRLFTPEHGLQGSADAGAAVDHSRDARTGIPVVSLYGKGRKPTAEQLEGVDRVVFDMQDVGVRCYTYASTMHYVMEACAGLGIPLVVLDRPNPNGYFVDGPVLQLKYRSFVGMHPVPWVHGMTLGELARMINGEGWLQAGARCDLTVIPCANYTHARRYVVPVAPSPNLPNQKAILLYPTLALLEGTTLSVGRGTDWPFQVAGAPTLEEGDFNFIPSSRPGAHNPLHEGETCHGLYLLALPDSVIYAEKGILIPILQRLYAMHQTGKKFFTPFFEKLAGTPFLRSQLEGSASPSEIRAAWRADIELFMARRKPYLLYD